MARRLLGPANAASVLDTQGEENMQNAQVTGDLSLELGFPVIVLWPACAWTGQRWGLFGTSAGVGSQRQSCLWQGFGVSQSDGRGGKFKHHSLAVPDL